MSPGGSLRASRALAGAGGPQRRVQGGAAGCSYRLWLAVWCRLSQLGGDEAEPRSTGPSRSRRAEAGTPASQGLRLKRFCTRPFRCPGQRRD